MKSAAIIGIFASLLLIAGRSPSFAATGVYGTTDQGTQEIDPGTFTAEVPIPGLFSSEKIDRDLAGKYIRAVYIAFIWIVGLLATVMVTWGGIKWVAAAGNPVQINDARDTINSAIIGVILALTSYLLLYIINPKFVQIGLPPLEHRNSVFFTGAIAPVPCMASARVACGEIREIGKIKNVEGKEVPEYCMGTQCTPGLAILGGGTDIVCSLSKYEFKRDDGTTFVGLKPKNGCREYVTLDTSNFSAEGRANIDPEMKVTHDQACGIMVAKNPNNQGITTTRVGNNCNRITTKSGGDNLFCYAEEPVTYVQGPAGQNDFLVDQMYCPQLQENYGVHAYQTSIPATP